MPACASMTMKESSDSTFLDRGDEVLDKPIDALGFFEVHPMAGVRQDFEPRAGQGLGQEPAGLGAALIVAAEHDKRRDRHRRDALFMRIKRRAALLHAAHRVGEALDRETLDLTQE